MRVEEFESSGEKAWSGNAWLRLALIFLAASLLWLLLGYWLGEQIILCWLVVAAAYAVTILVRANPRLLREMDSRRKLKVARVVVGWLSPLFWGGVLTTPYLFIFLFLLDRENFFPR